LGISFPCAIGVANPIFNLVLDEVPDALPAIAVDASPVYPFIRFIVRPCGQQDYRITISAILDDIVIAGAVVDVVHVSIPHGPFLLLGRTDVGAVAIIRPTLTYSVLAPIFFVAIKKYY
jgi:hypothetical protein